MSSAKVELNDIKVKKLDEEDKMVDFAIKCTITNHSEWV